MEKRLTKDRVSKKRAAEPPTGGEPPSGDEPPSKAPRAEDLEAKIAAKKAAAQALLGGDGDDF